MSGVWITPSLAIVTSRLFQMNSGAFVRDGEAYLVDPGILPDEIDELAAIVAEHDARVRGVILTHSHWDHILGPERLPGVPVIAHARVANLLRDDADAVAQRLAERVAAEGFARSTPFVVPRIAITLEDELSLPLGAGSLELTHAPGHCSDQIVLFDPLTRTLWAADMLSDLEIPFVEDIHAYVKTLARLRQLDIATLVPGHGNPTADSDEIQRRLVWDHDYLVHLEQEVQRGVKAGRTLADLTQALVAWPLRRPDLNAREHLRNIEAAYETIAR